MKLEDMPPFKFSEDKDKLGLPLEHRNYVKRSCNRCLGRGFEIQSMGGRHYQTCNCVKRGYARTRALLETKTFAWVRDREAQRKIVAEVTGEASVPAPVTEKDIQRYRDLLIASLNF